MDIRQFLTDAVNRKASDIYIVGGRPATYKVNGHMTMIGDDRLMPEDTAGMMRDIYVLADRDPTILLRDGDDDFSFALPGVSRFRVNAYKQRGSQAAVIRVVNFDLPDPSEIGIPQRVLDLSSNTKGLVLVTGPAGGGKSTTLACLIDRINRERSEHIITLEDPLEYLHRHNKSIVSQREIFTDTESYVKALRAALRQSPDVILLGEMRGFEVIDIAMTAAETGHLVISTMHTVGAASTIDRIIDAFPSNLQYHVHIQLSMVLQAIVSQQLVPTLDGGVVPAFEVMIVNNGIRNMIRESKIHQIDAVIRSSSSEGMRSMDESLFVLYKNGVISDKDAVFYSTNSDMMAKRLAF